MKHSPLLVAVEGRREVRALSLDASDGAETVADGTLLEKGAAAAAGGGGGGGVVVAGL